MNVKKTVDNFRECRAIFQCPLCGKSLSLDESGSFICGRKHCFDLSSKGYASFLVGKGMKSSRYDKVLFASRTRIMQDGFYNSVVDELSVQINGASRILDAGCGEGFFTAELRRRTGAMVFGIDNCTEAIKLAAEKDTSVKWLAADLANIPLKDRSVDAVINILAPANYAEFSRILVSGGKIVKVIPGSDYLCELRACAAGLLRHMSHESGNVLEYFTRNTCFIAQKTIRETVPLSQEQLHAFIQMTPMLSDIRTEDIDFTGVMHITIHLEVLTGEGKAGPRSAGGKALR